MNWFLSALLCPVFWTLCNLFDQFLARDYFTNRTTSFIAMTGLSSLPLLGIFAGFYPEALHIDTHIMLLLLVSSSVYVLAMYPYMAALQQDDVSVVVPIFQILPILVFLISRIVLGEHIDVALIGPGSLILLAAIGITWDVKHRHFRKTTLFNILIACVLFACNTVLVRYWTSTNIPALTVAFWHMAGWSVASVLILIFHPSTRRHVSTLLVETKGRIFVISLIPDSLDILSAICLSIALTTAPSAGLVSLITNNIHPAMTFIMGGLLACIVPRLFDSLRTDQQTVLKIVAMIIMIVGYIWLYHSEPHYFD